MIFVIKTLLNINRLIVAGGKKYLSLEINLKKEKRREKTINGHISLLNSLHENLFNRFFEINKEIISLQKILFNSN
jgi:hypothetical protein